MAWRQLPGKELLSTAGPDGAEEVQQRDGVQPPSVASDHDQTALGPAVTPGTAFVDPGLRVPAKPVARSAPANTPPRRCRCGEGRGIA